MSRLHAAIEIRLLASRRARSRPASPGRLKPSLHSTSVSPRRSCWCVRSTLIVGSGPSAWRMMLRRSLCSASSSVSSPASIELLHQRLVLRDLLRHAAAHEIRRGCRPPARGRACRRARRRPSRSSPCRGYSGCSSANMWISRVRRRGRALDRRGERAPRSAASASPSAVVSSRAPSRSPSRWRSRPPRRRPSRRRP